MSIDEEEIENRKAWLDFNEQDEKRLHNLDEISKGFTEEIVEELYNHFLSIEETRKFFEDPKTLAYVKDLQKQYFSSLTKGNYDSNYVSERIQIASMYAAIGLDVKWYLGTYRFYLRNIVERIFKLHKNDPQKALSIIFSLNKLAFLDIGIALDTYIFRREKTISKQQEAIRELSTPVLQLREELLILPIIGAIDTNRARQLTEQLLHTIRDKRAKVVVVDVTGVPTVDSRVANHLVQTVDAARLMGATLIITGLSAEVAHTLVTIGVDLSMINTIGDLQGGIEEAERMLGYQVKKPLSNEGEKHESPNTQTW
ncbi:MAG: STAS domain-containing protein [Gammaproteobacteria bacterium]|nr:STAS domain-containing protein [Gammaproteobacteria bacterium]